MYKIFFLFFIFTNTAAANSNFESLKERYLHGRYPQSLFTTYERMYWGNCYGENSPEMGESARLHYRRWQNQSEASLDTFSFPYSGFHFIESRDYRTAYLFGAFPDQVEIRELGFNFIVRIFDGFAPHKAYCLF